MDAKTDETILIRCTPKIPIFRLDSRVTAKPEVSKNGLSLFFVEQRQFVTEDDVSFVDP